MKRAMAILLVLGAGLGGRVRGADEERIPLTISGGHETDPSDRGRPVILIANALGVKAETFREAFSHVTPAEAGRTPDEALVQRNKAALLGALAQHGVTNERLDRVSDYYRYRPGGDSLWPNAPASAYAVMRDGAVTAIVVTEAGSGYSSAPHVSIPGHPEIRLNAIVGFDRDFRKNGAVVRIARGH